LFSSFIVATHNIQIEIITKTLRTYTSDGTEQISIDGFRQAKHKTNFGKWTDTKAVFQDNEKDTGFDNQVCDARFVNVYLKDK